MESLLGQTLRELEIILVDDGSPDSCPQMCDAYAAEHAQVTVVHTENQGLGMARNAGLEHARGSYVAFVDSDDYLARTGLEELCRLAVATGADTVLGSYTRVGDDGSLHRGQNPLGNRTFSGTDEILGTVLAGMLGSPPDYFDDIYQMMSVWMGLYSLEIIREHGIRFCSERQFISEDLIFDLDYYPHARKVAIGGGAHYFYCENGESLTLTYREDRFERNKELFRELERRCDELGLDVRDRLDRSFLGRVRQCLYAEARHQPGRAARARMRRICSDARVQEVCRRYPTSHYPPKLRLLTFLMRHRAAALLHALCVLMRK
jgi:glycosyltransferase involved in cell wall biosynthesis